jgi:hypothetical protein
MRRVGLWLINSGVDHWRQFVALLQCLPPPSARRGGNVQIRRASQRLDVIGAFSESFRLSRATSKGPPFCHKLGTTSAVVGRVLIFV